MIAYLTQFFKGISKPKSDFSEFFTSASAQEKKKVFRNAIQAANREQRELVEQYEKMQSK